MKAFFSRNSNEDPDKISLLNDIELTKKALQIAYDGFDNATDPDLIDCYIYEVNSVLKRYKFLLEEAAKLYSLPVRDADMDFVNELELNADAAGAALTIQALIEI